MKSKSPEGRKEKIASKAEYNRLKTHLVSCIPKYIFLIIKLILCHVPGEGLQQSADNASRLSRSRFPHQNHYRRSSDYKPHDARGGRYEGDADSDGRMPGYRKDHLRSNDHRVE